MTPEQLKIHQEKVARLAEKNLKKKEVFTLISFAVVVFCVGLTLLGTMIYSIRKNNPHHTQAETQKIHNMNYEEVQQMKKTDK